MLTVVQHLGKYVLSLLREMGRMLLFLISALYMIVRFPGKPILILKQINFIGAKSFFVIFLTAAFTGMVLGLQGYYTLTKFGSEGMLGSVVALSLIRELGPVLTALMVTGRAGSAITAEIGIMRITEQIDALETMALEPFKYLVSPKIIGALIAVPLLCAIFDMVGIGGGYLVGVKLMGVNPGAYFHEMQNKRGVEGRVFGHGEVPILWSYHFLGLLLQRILHDPRCRRGFPVNNGCSCHVIGPDSGLGLLPDLDSSVGNLESRIFREKE